MDPRLLMTAARILDPRKARTRAKQLGIGVLGVLILWWRSVQAADGAVAVREAKRARRNADIDARLREAELRYDATRR